MLLPITSVPPRAEYLEEQEQQDSVEPAQRDEEKPCPGVQSESDEESEVAVPNAVARRPVPAPRQTLRPRAPQAEDAGAKVNVPVVDPETDVQQNPESEDNRDAGAENGAGSEGPRNGERDEVICEEMDEEVELLPQLRRSNRVRRKPKWTDTDVYEFSQLSMDKKLHLLQSFISVLT